MKQLAFSLYFLATLTFAQNRSFDSYSGEYGMEDLKKIPQAPDYSNLDYWIAHPEVQDMADETPGKGKLSDNQENADVDVFFVYPTIYTGEQNPDSPWYADVNDTELNEKIANTTIKYQSTVFNASAKVYSPLYRQAHVDVFLSDSSLREQTLNLAYSDVKMAFEYYLKNWNDNRPIIIASHSQGTLHTARLIKDFFEEKPLMDKLVTAYIIGMPIKKNHFTKLPICERSDQTTCWITWNTYLANYYPDYHEKWYSNAASVNPLDWTTDEKWVSRDNNSGGVLKKYDRIRPGLTDARNSDGMLWIHKPHFFGNVLLRWKRFHHLDYNLFYLNIRENVAERIKNYFEQSDLATN